MDLSDRALQGSRDHRANQTQDDGLCLRTYQSGQRSSGIPDGERTSQTLPNRSDVLHTSLFYHRLDDLSF